MSARGRVLVLLLPAAAALAATTVLVAKRGDDDGGGGARSGTPPLALDLGLRTDSETLALRRAAGLYVDDERIEAARIFELYDSPAAQVGAAFARWPRGTLATVEGLAERRPRDSLVLLHLGLARLWNGDERGAAAALIEARDAQPDTPYSVTADGLLHPDTAPGVPKFVPSFPTPPGLNRLDPDWLQAARRAARRPDVRAKLLYGLALQRLGRQRSAERLYAAAARLAPSASEPQVAVAVARFSKSRPVRAFGRLGPLARRFPNEPTVRFHLGLLLAWLGRTEAAKEQFERAARIDPDDPLGREADRVLDRLEGGRP